MKNQKVTKFLFQFTVVILICFHFLQITANVNAQSRKYALPQSIDLSNGMPAQIGDQGTQGSCTAWAVGYYYKSFQEKKEHGWDYNEKHLFSPSYIYNQRSNKSSDNGMWADEAINLIINQGIAPIAFMPTYDQNDWATPPSDEAKAVAAQYKATQLRVFKNVTVSDLNELRAHLAGGDPFVMDIPIYTNYSIQFDGWNPSLVVYVPEVIDDPSGPNWYKVLNYRHSVTIVGYDDILQRFKFVNSWGNKWPSNHSGYGYLTYRFVLEVVGGTNAYFMTDGIDPTPMPPIVITKPPHYFDSAEFINDITLPDAFTVISGQSYTKTWELKNIGTTTWGSGYQLVYITGEQMGAPAAVDVPSTPPGSTANISINITGPSNDGLHQGNWRLRNPQGTYFGPTIWVKVAVGVSNPGSQIILFDVNPASPSSAQSIHIVGRIKYFNDFRSMRIVIGNEVQEMPNFRTIDNQMEISFDWNTSSLARGNYSIIFEVAKTGDSSWSQAERQVKTFTLEGAPAMINHPPDRPVLQSPYDWYLQDSAGAAASIELCVHPASDPDSNPVQYWFEVKDQGGGVVATSGWTSSSCWTNSYNPTTYSWRVKTSDGSAQSDWSNENWHFSVAGGGVYIGSHSFFATDTNDTHLCVYVTYDGIQAPNVYAWINLATDGSDSGEWRLLDHYGPNTTPDCTQPNYHGFWIRSPNYETGTHLIKISGIKTDSGASATTTTSLAIGYIKPPDPVALVPSSLTNNGTWWNTRTIDFQWTPSIRTDNYTLRVSTNPSPWDDPSPIVNQVLSSSTTNYSFTFNQDYGQLYWNIRASNSAGYGDSGGGNWFGIDQVVPDCMVQALPVSTYENVFQVDWLADDNSAGVRSSDIQYMDSERGTWQDWLISAPASKPYELFTGQQGHTYYFRCRSTDNAGNTNAYPSYADTSIKVDAFSRPPTPWWNSSYAHKRNLPILNNMPGTTLPAGYPVHLHFDTGTTPTAADIYNSSLTAAKCNDVRVLYNDTTELDRLVENCSATAIDIWFRTGASISGGTSDSTSHQLYYGNVSAGAPPARLDKVFWPESNSSTLRYYAMREGSGSTLYDLVSKGNASMSSAMYWTQSGKFGPAVVFPGDGGSEPRPAVDDGSSYMPSSAGFTVEFWLKRGTVDGGNIANQVVSGNSPRWALRIVDGNLRLYVWPSTSAGSSDVQANRSLNETTFYQQFHHFAVTFNGGNQVAFYIDGALDSVKTLSQNGFSSSSSPLRIGASDINSGRLDGQMFGFVLSDGVKTNFSYGQFAAITSEPTAQAGLQVNPPTTGQVDLAILDMSASPNSDGTYTVEVTVKNNGTISTQNGFYTDLYINHLPTGANDYTGSVRFWVNDAIEPGQTVSLATVLSKIEVTGASEPVMVASSIAESSVTLYSQTDSMGTLVETDKGNNLFTPGIQICLTTMDPYEEDNSAPSAKVILMNQAQTHNFHSTEDEDWYKFTALSGRAYEIATSNLAAGSDTEIFLYGTDGTTLLAQNDDSGGTFASKLNWFASTDGVYYVQAKHWNPFVGGCGTSYDFKITESVPTFLPPGVPLLVTPVLNGLVTINPPKLDWNNSTVPAGRYFDHYHIQVAKDAGFATPEINEDVSGGVTNSEFTPSSPLDSNTRYYWRVNACNTYLQCSSWSVVRYFRTAILAPTLIAPVDALNLLTNRPTFEWEDVAGANGYTLQISRNNIFTLMVTAPSTVASTFTPIMDLPANTTLYWRVQAKGVNGPSAWSVVRSFTTANPPSVPVLVAPALNALVTNYQPKLDWNNSTVPLGTTFDHYHIQVATDAAFTTPVIDQDVPGGVTSSEYTTTPLNPNTKYYWRVNAWNTAGQYSSWSVVRYFRTAILAPTLTTPVDALNLLTNRPTFDWEDVAGANGYTLQVSRNNIFTLIVTAPSTVASTFTPITDLPANTTLYWRVQAKGVNGPSAWSVVRSFTTANPPSIPVLVAPALNALVTNYLPKLDWNNSIVPLGTTFDHYHIQVATDAAFASPVIDLDVPGGVTISEYTLTTPLNPNTKYYWRVNAWNTAGQYSSWSVVRYFRTVILPPALVAPTNLAPLLTNRPVFDWGDVPGASSYTIQISRNNTFTMMVTAPSTIASTFTPIMDLPANTTLYWRVQAKGVNGPSAWSVVRSFTTANPPGIPVLVAPALNALVTNYQPKLDWNNSTVSLGTTFDHYQIQVATDAAFTSPVIDQNVAGITNSEHTPTPPLNPNTKYYWRVNAWNLGGQYSSWSAVRYFRTAIEKPVLSSPGNGSTVSCSPVSMQWGAVSGATSYSMVYSTSPSFLSTVAVSTTSTSVSRTILVKSTYYWKVKANGVNGPSLWSDVFSFTCN